MKRRPQSEIKSIHIDPEVESWEVMILYKDNKMVEFSVDYGQKNEDMLDLTYKCIRQQLHG